MADSGPAEVFAPGEFLLDILNDREWSQVDFAEIIGRSTKAVNEIVNGKAAITPAMARDIAAATDTNPMFWLNLETAYRLHSEGAAPSPRIVRHAKLRAKYPVRDMVLRGWVENSPDPEVLEKRVLAFFGTKTLDEEPRLMAHAAKKTGVPDDINGPQRAWLFRVKQIASAMTVDRYSESKLREAIPVLRQMLVNPEDIRRVPKILAECGVRFVIVQHVPSSKIDGVCFWLSKASDPVIAMSLRLDRIDNFWFVLRHEIEHVLNNDGREEAMVDIDMGVDRPKDMTLVEELRADKAAQDFCVPSNDMADFMVRHGRIISDLHVVNFAQRMGVHPGLVAGQIRRRTGNYKLFQRHLVSVRPIISEVAMTDGYGHTISI